MKLPDLPEAVGPPVAHPLATETATFVIASGLPRRVLLLGVGSGRNVAPFLDAGIAVDAVEADAERRAAATVRFAREPRVTIASGSYADPFPFSGPYGAVVSTHALLHGSPREIAAAIATVRAALAPEGLLAITLGSTHDARFGAGACVEARTYVSPVGDEAGVPHVFFDEAEARELVAGFRIHSLLEIDAGEIVGRWAHGAGAATGTVHWFVLARVAPTATFVPRDARTDDRVAAARDAIEAVANALPQLVWIAEPGGRVTYFNHAYYDVTGFPRDREIAMADWYDVVHPDDVEAVISGWSEAVATGSAYEIEFRMGRSGTGRYRWYLSRSRPMIDADGRIVRWFGTSTDIDVQKRYQARSDERAAEMKVIADAIPQMVWTALPDGTVDYYSARFLDYLQMSGDDLRREGWEMIVHPDDLARTVDAWTRAHTFGEPYEIEHRLFRTRDRVYRWFLNRALPYRAPDGSIERWLGSATDVDVQKRRSDRRESVIGSLVRAYMPAQLPAFEPFALDAVYVPAEEETRVGGDFFETVVLPGGDLLFAIGDVAGHGVDAAVVMGRARNAMVMAALDTPDPSELLRHVNRALVAQGSTMVTAIAGILERGTGRFRYATAGHPPAILAPASAPSRRLAFEGRPLGILDDIGTKTFHGTLAPGDTLFLYTDGITEYDRDVPMGELKLTAAIEAAVATGAPAHAILRTLLGERRAPDDIALLSIAHPRSKPAN